MRIALIWAMAKNRVIGINNSLPWRISGDLQHFKRVTMGKPVIMGRNTWESLGRALPGRPNIVISRSTKPESLADTVIWVPSVDHGIAYARNWLQEQGAEADQNEAVIIGGAQIYLLTLPLADRLYVTQVEADVTGDTYFPEFDESTFKIVSDEFCLAGEKDDFDYRVLEFERQSG